MMTITEAAAELNENAARVTIRESAWERYAQEGAIVRIHVRRWRGKATLTLRDLGISAESAEANAAMQKLVQLGSRRLLPAYVLDRLMQLDTLSRNTLRRYSVQTPSWGFFVPRKAYAGWSEANENVRQAYLSYALAVADDWESLTREVYDNYVALGLSSYQRLVRAGALSADTDQTEWVKNFATKAVSSTPTAEGFLATVSYDWESCYVPFTNGQSTLPAASLDAMERDVRATMARKAQEDLGRFMAEIQTGIRQRVLEVAEKGLAALKTNGVLGRGASKALNNLVEMVDRLKFYPDEELDEKLRELSSLVEVRAEKRNTDRLEQVLSDLSQESRLILRELAQPQPRGANPNEIELDEIELGDESERGATDFDGGLFDDLPMPTERGARDVSLV